MCEARLTINMKDKHLFINNQGEKFNRRMIVSFDRISFEMLVVKCELLTKIRSSVLIELDKRLID